MRAIILGCMICSIFTGCKPPVETSVKEIPEESSSIQRNTVLTGILLTKSNDQRFSGDNSHPCGKLPCIGTLKINAIEQKGMDYHGQFHIGDTITAFFTYTLGNSGMYFPKKVPPPNDVPLNSVIKCEVKTQPEGNFIVENFEMSNL